tara:strand:- start:66 stop:284 length:219 start_codon:yes stop_codon:yes gene_type:complete
MSSSTRNVDRYTTTESGGRQNIYSVEPKVQVEENYQGYWKNAEKTNGRLAMIGLFAAVFNYTVFGWIIPGIA